MSLAPHSHRHAAALQPQLDLHELLWMRACCRVCGEAVVSNAYYVGGKGYIIVWECWASLGEPTERTCDYRRVL